jgi:hypothetical protein
MNLDKLHFLGKIKTTQSPLFELTSKYNILSLLHLRFNSAYLRQKFLTCKCKMSFSN